MRAATLNVWGRSGEWERRRQVLIDGLRELAPDVMALQEVEDGQAEDLLGPEYEVIHRGGIAIASRLPIGEVHELEGEQDQPGTLLAEVDGPDPLLFVNHFPSWAPAQEASRERETVAAARLVEEIVGTRHVVLGGDLDAMPEASSIRFLRGLQALEGTSVRYLDAWDALHPGEPGHTFTTRNPLVMEESAVTREEPRRIDYLFVRCTEDGPTLDVSDCRLLFDDPRDGGWASDHFGVVADLTPYR
jgi:endonuclease/exonuclease/phosphatase family metal-dependent hydrolase